MSETQCEGGLAQQAVAYLARRQHADGLALAELAIRATPDEPMAWYVLGEARRQLRLFDTAQVAFERARALNPDSPWSDYSIGVLHYQRGELAGAYQIVGNVVVKYPKHTASYELLSDILLRQGRPVAASQALRFGLRTIFEPWIGQVQKALEDQSMCEVRTRHNLWLRHALQAARRLARVRNRRARVASAVDRARLQAAGQWDSQLWVDEEVKGAPVRVLLANFFYVLAVPMLRDALYLRLLEKRAVVLRMIGREREARVFQCEAEDLRRRGSRACVR
jgi:tetratricopeptide (TPR) repeat protein